MPTYIGSCFSFSVLYCINCNASQQFPHSGFVISCLMICDVTKKILAQTPIEFQATFCYLGMALGIFKADMTVGGEQFSNCSQLLLKIFTISKHSFNALVGIIWMVQRQMPFQSICSLPLPCASILFTFLSFWGFRNASVCFTNFSIFVQRI